LDPFTADIPKSSFREEVGFVGWRIRHCQASCNSAVLLWRYNHIRLLVSSTAEILYRIWSVIGYTQLDHALSVQQ